MSEKRMKKYPAGIREEVVSRVVSTDHLLYFIVSQIKAGESQRALSQEYGISRWAIHCWIKESVLPKIRGRKPAKTLAEYEYENKQLKMESELLRDFLQFTERK